MAGGIAVLLFITVLLVVGGIALALYGTGGFFSWSDTRRDADRAETPSDGRGDPRRA